MDSDHLKSHSLWSATANMPVYPPLSANLSVEVCVIGAGIAGLTTAYLLARQGISVVVLEALGVGEGETSRTTAHIAVPDDRYWHIEESYGEDSARQVADSFAAAVELIESIIAEEQIECEFRRLDGFLFARNASQEHSLDRELTAARRAGVVVGRTGELPFDSRLQGEFCASQIKRSFIRCNTLLDSLERSSTGAALFIAALARSRSRSLQMA